MKILVYPDILTTGCKIFLQVDRRSSVRASLAKAKNLRRPDFGDDGKGAEIVRVETGPPHAWGIAAVPAVRQEYYPNMASPPKVRASDGIPGTVANRCGHRERRLDDEPKMTASIDQALTPDERSGFG
uniref:hypothetical protein n=1 Tax=Sphingomonas sp. TaxID=28214 RepID=UPI0025E1A11A|nr:hypothetical protein [Sphingomonas sp.]